MPYTTPVFGLTKSALPCAKEKRRRFQLWRRPPRERRKEPSPGWWRAARWGRWRGAGARGLMPGVGPVIAAGILAGTLGGAGAGATAGGILGALIGHGVPEADARHYEQEVAAGKTIVTVKADGRYDEAVNILRKH